MPKNLEKLVRFSTLATAAIILMSTAGCRGDSSANAVVDLTKVSRMACHNDGTLPSAWETAGLIITLNAPDSAMMSIAEENFIFSGRYIVAPTSLTMTFPGGVDASGNASLLKSPVILSIDSLKVIGKDEDGWPLIETYGFNAKCIVELRAPVALAATSGQPSTGASQQEPVDPITEDFIVKTAPQAPASVGLDISKAPGAAASSLDSNRTAETAASEASVDAARQQNISRPQQASEDGARNFQSSPDATEKLGEKYAVERDSTNGEGRQIASYNPRLEQSVVKSGQPIKIHSTVKFNGSQGKNIEVKEQLIAFDKTGRSFASGTKPMVANAASDYENSFVLTFPEDIERGAYSLKMNLYLNGLHISTRELRIQIE